VITGKVRTGERSVARALIEALRVSFVSGESVLTVAGSTQSDDRGEYRIYGLLPGKYYVKVASPSLPDTLTTYAPNGEDVASAAVIGVTQGGEISGIDVSLRQGKPVRVTGRVDAGSAEDAASRLSLYLEPRDSRNISTVTLRAVPNLSSSLTDFQLRVEPGIYNLYAIVQLRSGKSLSGKVPLEVRDRDIDELHIPLSAGVRVTGQIDAKDGERPTANAVRVQLRPIGNRAYTLLQLTAQNNGAGGFEFPNVPPGDYAVQLARGRTPWFLSDIKSDGRSIYDDAILTVRDQNQRLEITIGQTGGRIDGVVLKGAGGGSPVGAGVFLVPAAATRTGQEFTRTGTADAEGRFTLIGIPPGDYKLIAIEQGNVDSPADVRSKYSGQGINVKIAEGSSLTIDPVLITLR
jgi:hypothetical protein